MAELNHISTQTLRLYEKKGLLIPAYLDSETGYRYYTLEQCAKLDLIHALKSCRLSLKEIERLFKKSSINDLADMFALQSEKLAEEIYDLTVSKNNLQKIHKNLQTLNSLPPFGQPYFEYMEERKIDAQKTDFDFFTTGKEGYEKMIRQMQNYLFSNRLSPSYFINVGTICDQNDFEKQTYRSDTAFIFVDELYPERGSVRYLPGGLYLCIISDDVNRELSYAKELYLHVKTNHMRLVGDYVCEVLSKFPFTEDNYLIYKIQIPVGR